MDLQNVKETLEKNLEALCSLDKNQFGDVIIDGIPCYPLMVELVGRTREALAELKKTDCINAMECADKINAVCYDTTNGYDSFLAEAFIQQYAESYHAKKCVHCQKVVYCELCGDPISVGVCENCVPEVINKKENNV